MLNITLKALAGWGVILLFAIANGALREAALIPLLGRSAGLVLSGLILSGGIFLVAWLLAPRYGRGTAVRYGAIGLLWLGLTLVFEFSLGRWVQHKSWAELMQPYMFNDGNLWPVVLIVTLVSPWLAARMRGPA